ncbi:ATP-binding protein [Halalkalibacter alkalisediminis]|uniref:histidine kinase n=1 Tax=Halalkalibacter alkalisediminis TaxID=935616 RepID=A0ABV6NEY6_9BACI|nr:sensor histidine kinase [Halalkalibacter alkalisediminis]
MNKLVHIPNIPTRWKITGLAFGIVAFTLVIIGIILIGYLLNVKEDQLSHRAMITGQLVAQNPIVQQNIESEHAADILQSVVERIRVINDHDYIVILNMERIRLTHPIHGRVNTPFVGGDEGPAFTEHIYVSKAQANGEAISVRAFVPIKKPDQIQEQIGVVVVGNVLPTVKDILYEFRHTIFVIAFITSLFGVWGAWLLASHIKKQTFEMEPEELARVLVERTATFNAMHEGVIAIDDQERITIMNSAAIEMMSLNKDQKMIGAKIQDVIPDTRLPEILEIGKPIYQRDLYVRNRAILSNRIPITVGDKTVGAVAIFQDRTEVNRLAQELTGVQAFVEALRVKNHEYSNKLHTIAGLIQLEEPQKALEYIFELNEEQSGLSQMLMRQIHDDNVAGLLLGKVSRGKELGISIKVNKSSEFIDFPEGVTNHDLVVILGNLIDNSFDALADSPKLTKEVDVLLKGNEQELLVQVTDNGSGIPANIIDQVYVRGFSTKQKEGRGIGLFLIHSIVSRVDGKIDMTSDEGGTEFTISLPMKRGVEEINE